MRGAAARLEGLELGERARGVVACSSGNHGRAVAFVAGRMGVPAIVFVPEWVDPVKLDGIERAGAEARRAGATFDEAEALAVAFARDRGRVYVSAYDDPWVIAGQGTIAFEIIEQLGRVPSALVVPLSGGGLVGGIAAAFQRAERPPLVVAASAERAAVMLASVRAGAPVTLPEEETLANALAGGIGEHNRHSFRLVRDLVDRHVAVTEAEIERAMRYAMERVRVVVEGGGAVALAAWLAAADRGVTLSSDDSGVRLANGDPRAKLLDDGPVVLVLSGGNVAPETLARVIGRREAAS